MHQSSRTTSEAASDDWSYDYALASARNRQHKERSRFIMIAFFDCAFVALIWVLKVVSAGPDWVKDFKNELDLSNADFFTQSLFDVALSSVVRLLWLCIWYWALKCSIWLPVAFSTASTSVFLIVKVLYYFSVHQPGKSSYTAPEYILIIGSFVSTWLELWLSPVTPPSIMNRPIRSQSAHANDEERLIGSRARVSAANSSRTDDDFRTTHEHGSSSDEASTRSAKSKKSKQTLPEYRPYSNAQYIDAAKSAMAQGRDWLQQIDQWPLQRKQPIIRSTHDKIYAKIYYLQIDCARSALSVFNVLHTKAPESPSWNKTLLECKSVFRVDEFTDVTYSVSAPALSGYISSRDFLDVRYAEQDLSTESWWVSAVSVYSTIVPPGSQHKVVRGVNGPNLWVIRPTGTHSCTLQWIMNTNLKVNHGVAGKGDLPRRLVDRGFLSFLTQFATSLNNHLSTLPLQQ